MANLGSLILTPKFGAIALAHPADSTPAVALMLRRFGRFAILTPNEIERVRLLAPLRKRWRSGTTLPSGETAAQFMVSGWACIQRVLRDGRRQILDFILPGEGFGFGALSQANGHYVVLALTTVETLDARSLMTRTEDGSSDGLRRAIEGMGQEEDGRRLDHMVRLGRLTGPEKVAHFFLEMQRRAGAAADARGFPLPLTQETIADALGLSVVHLNRILRQMRSSRLLEFRNGVAAVPDLNALTTAAVLPLAEERAPSL